MQGGRMTHGSGSRLVLALGAATAIGLATLALPAPVWSQDGGLFSPALIINGQVVTNYEVEQRIKFLQVLRVPGDPEKEALKALTADRLGQQEAKRLNIKLTDEQVKNGMQEFAARANLDVPAFVKAIGDEGVEPETFRDFVSAGLLWREVVRTKFGGTVRISNTQIDRALAEAARKPDVKLLLSELVVPVPEGTDSADVLAEVRDIKANMAAEGGFAAAARKFSAAPTAQNGGRLEWLPLSNLPPAITGQLLGLAPGEVSDPVVVPQAVVLFQLNGLSDSESPAPASVKVSYAQFTLSPDQDPAAILSQADGCGDLYPIARSLPADRLRVTEDVDMAAVPTDIGLELAKLDPGEAVLRGQNGARELLMLCLRNGVQPTPEPSAAPAAAEGETAAAASPTPTPTPLPRMLGEDGEEIAGEFVQPDPQRETLRTQLGNQQLSVLADAYMEELRSEAIIKTP